MTGPLTAGTPGPPDVPVPGPRPEPGPGPEPGPVPRRPSPRPQPAGPAGPAEDEVRAAPSAPPAPPAPRVLYTAPPDDEHDDDRVGHHHEGSGRELVEIPGPDSGRHRAAVDRPVDRPIDRPVDRRAAERADQPARSGGVRARVGAAVGELRFVRERPSSLVDHVAYARHGQWTTEQEGQRRSAALVWAYLVAIPVSTVAYLAVWAVARPTRAAVVVAVAAVLATALNQIPYVELLVPDWASLTAWPPLSWF